MVLSVSIILTAVTICNPYKESRESMTLEEFGARAIA
jgi:hypothetical protein